VSVYKKLQDIRVKLQEAGLKKSGENKFAGYKYFELEDFIPTVNQMFAADGLCSTLEYSTAGAELAIFESDKPEVAIRFTVPMSTASLKGCHEVQNLGAVISYLRRYLWTMALEIVESDALDKTLGKDAPASPHKPQPKELPKVLPIEPEKLRRYALTLKDADALNDAWTTPEFYARYEISDKAAVDAVYKEALEKMKKEAA
jgi:hypothetical protein